LTLKFKSRIADLSVSINKSPLSIFVFLIDYL